MSLGNLAVLFLSSMNVFQETIHYILHNILACFVILIPVVYATVSQ